MTLTSSPPAGSGLIAAGINFAPPTSSNGTINVSIFGTVDPSNPDGSCGSNALITFNATTNAAP
jgi:hypothetical protein